MAQGMGKITTTKSQHHKMNEIQGIINTQNYNKLNIDKLAKNGSYEILHISLEKDAIFPEHTSPTNAQLIVLEGAISFHIDQKSYTLHKHQYLGFAKEVKHWVQAKENANFLIIR